MDVDNRATLFDQSTPHERNNHNRGFVGAAERAWRQRVCIRTETTTTAVGHTTQTRTTALYNPQGSNPNSQPGGNEACPTGEHRKPGGHTPKRPNEHLRQRVLKCDTNDKLSTAPNLPIEPFTTRPWSRVGGSMRSGDRNLFRKLYPSTLRHFAPNTCHRITQSQPGATTKATGDDLEKQLLRSQPATQEAAASSTTEM